MRDILFTFFQILPPTKSLTTTAQIHHSDSTTGWSRYVESNNKYHDRNSLYLSRTTQHVYTCTYVVQIYANSVATRDRSFKKLRIGDTKSETSAHTHTPTSQQVDQDVESPKYNHRNSLPVRSNARTLVTLRNRPFTQSLVLNPPNTIIETLSLSLSLYLSKQLRTQYTSRRSNSVTLRPFKKSPTSTTWTLHTRTLLTQSICWIIISIIETLQCTMHSLWHV